MLSLGLSTVSTSPFQLNTRMGTGLSKVASISSSLSTGHQVSHPPFFGSQW